MARVEVGDTVSPVVIKKFLGLNMSRTGATQLKLGESGNMENFIITDDYKLRKVKGYKSLFTTLGTIRGLYKTKINNHDYLMIAANGKLMQIRDDEIDNISNWNTDVPKIEIIGDIKDEDTSFFSFGNKVYVLCGDYMCFDGNTLEKVTGYTPLVAINTPSGDVGGGLIYDELNMINPQRHQQFNGEVIEDGATYVTYTLLEKNLDSIDKVIVDGEDTTEYNFNLTLGQVYLEKTTKGTNNIDIYYSVKTEDSGEDIIRGMKFGTIFGGGVDTRVFLYGNPSYPNRTYFSGIADGTPSVEYFPATAHVDVGPSNYTLTDLTRQYDRLLATTNRPEAYYMTISTDTIDESIPGTTSTVERLVPSVSTYPLNESHGNVAMGQGQVVHNNPITVEDGEVIEWKSTNVRDERNMSVISERIRVGLERLSMKDTLTLDHESENQLWIVNDRTIYIYNYENDTFSKVTTKDTITHLIDFKGDVWASTDTNKLIRWGEEYEDFDGEIINAHWEMNFYDFGASYLRKAMKRIWVLMQPQAKSSATISYVSNRNDYFQSRYISYNLTFLDDVDFSDFTFVTSQNPKPFRLKLKAKKWTHLKIVIDNNERTDCTILELALRIETFGESK